MSAIEPLSKVEIKAWLAGLVVKGDHARNGVPKERTTIPDIAKYTGIPYDTLRTLSRNDNARMSAHRQMLLSKVIGLIENGYLVFHVEHGHKVGKILDRPQAKTRAKITFTARGPRLELVSKPPIMQRLPQFTGLKIGSLSKC